ncbi:anti-sigma factor domain-containing protein [Gordonia sp. (in: high G+C Gram-positive bacteria)]|uniref:anti-sigma factor n=1 Tax=Gordonia sp. (in: high G+C Gram-positive bacteria) TaxID=84139 RepID=UPI003C7725CB
MSDETGGAVDPGGPGDDLTAYAPLLALDALDEVERARLLRAVARAHPDERAAFDAEVRAVREAMAELSEATAALPPAGLRDRLLQRIDGDLAGADTAEPPVRVVDEQTVRPDGSADPGRSRGRGGFTTMRMVAAAAAAAVVLGVGGAVIGYSIAHQPAPESKTEQIFAAPDVRTTSGTLAGGRATVTYSPSTGEGVLVMNDVPQPTAGTLYQMWLVGPDGPRLAGTMTDADVSASTTAVISGMHGATAVAFTVGDAATPEKMISAPVAQLPLN